MPSWNREDDAAQWRRETVQIKAAYGDETMRAYVFLPKNRRPPYACVIDVPNDVAFQRASGATIRPDSYVLTSGRAMVYPVFKGTFERYQWTSFHGPDRDRDYLVMWRKDLGQNRRLPADTHGHRRVEDCLYGDSLGAEIAPMLLVTEPRVRLRSCYPEGLTVLRQAA